MNRGQRCATGIRTVLARLGWDRNALRPRSDRLATGGAVALLAMFLALAPLLSLAAGHGAGRAATAELQGQRSWHQVPAVLLQNAPALADGMGDNSWALARWHAPSGRAVTGNVMVPPGMPKGSSTRVWVDASGTWTGPPLHRLAIGVRAGLAVAATLAVLAAATLCLAGLGQRLLHRRRLAAWETDWSAVAPQWTKQFWARG